MTFNRVFPEGMPTVPARNAILSGRRISPSAIGSDDQGLMAKPGWAPLDDLDSAFHDRALASRLVDRLRDR